MGRDLVLMFRRVCAALALLAIGCGGGSPLLHGAHALEPGSTSSGVGFSATFTAGHARDAVDAARTGAPSSTNQSALKESAVRAAMAPSVAPWVGARVGITGDNEVGMAFTGRALRVDARHAFEMGSLAFSLGAGGTYLWRDSESSNASADFHARRGYGLDVPALVGWRSDAGVVSLWGGARGGLETMNGWGSTNTPPIMLDGDIDLLRRYVGGVAGLTMGFRHVHVSLELDVLYQWVSGDFESSTIKVDGLTLSPAAGLIFTF